VLHAALRGVTAAVVGVVLNLAVWFAVHTVFGDVSRRAFGVVDLPVPRLGSVDWRATLIAGLALLAVFRYRVGLYWVLAGGALLGLAFTA
jgi:chromate transporter